MTINLRTPGPWRVEEVRGSRVQIKVLGADVEVCKHNEGRGIEQTAARANARLIAAAPELLDALRLALAVHGDQYSWAAPAKAAIAKAEGRQDAA